MLQKADYNAAFFVAAALILFFIGGLLTTVVPPLLDQSWTKPFENNDPANGPTGKLKPLTNSSFRAVRSMFARVAGIATPSRRERFWPIPSVQVGEGVDAPNYSG